jgi:hypothetical protein
MAKQSHKFGVVLLFGVSCQNSDMTRVLERAIALAKKLSAERQDELGEMMLAVVEQEEASVQLTASQQAEVRWRLAAPLEFVPDDEMKAFSSNYAG